MKAPMKRQATSEHNRFFASLRFIVYGTCSELRPSGEKPTASESIRRRGKKPTLLHAPEHRLEDTQSLASTPAQRTAWNVGDEQHEASLGLC
jgi:hypothetical protein